MFFGRESSPARPYISKIDGFLPLNGKQEQAEFWADGTLTDYTLRTVSDGSKVRFQSISNNKVVDEEVYIVSNDQISLAHAAGEDFIGPIPLLKFPLSIGDHYDWKGQMACSKDKVDCTAKISTSTDFVTMKQKSEDAVKVEVEIQMDQGVPIKISFWFVKNRGVLKTEMGKNVREPKA